MQPLLLDIVTFLTVEGIVEGDGVDAYRDFIPEYPDDLVAVIEYKGDSTLHVDHAVHRSVQITTRSNDADKARATAVEIYKSLVSNSDDIGKIHFTDNRWAQLHIRQTPFRYKTDENNRAYYCFNIGLTTSLE